MSGLEIQLLPASAARGEGDRSAQLSGGGVGAKPLHHSLFGERSPSPSLRDRGERK
jgi:hypothetical protein